MEKYVILSLETHLVFARTMKEHALFLEAGFPGKDRAWIQRADMFRRQFEEILGQTVRISDGVISCEVLESQELVTDFTMQVEQQTQRLSGIPINSRITAMEQQLQSGSCEVEMNPAIIGAVNQINGRVIQLLNGLIAFKKEVLQTVKECRLFTTNYPLLIQHILREAEWYRSIVTELQENKRCSCKNMQSVEEFWNRIMMEHALFIRGLLDPSEITLIETADEFANQYGELLELENGENCCQGENITRKSLEETKKYQEFKEAGTEGIVGCEISSIMLPLLADHVLREANYYIRILKEDIKREKEND